MTLTLETHHEPSDNFRISTLEQFYCIPDKLRGTLQNPKWICVPIHRFFKLCPQETSSQHPSTKNRPFISVEIPPPHASTTSSSKQYTPSETNNPTANHEIVDQFECMTT
ncbi:hypothetical protein PCANC_01116 [Puccinia coronata f. sp. avenae]|uniref:Uncharacterized protein n=1 Tax=Puccinia coronata f. sp. avenae TaxID=200324 RepID=A0A2N5W5P9_9BASI|nr:hypothetical protein PCASD_19372 [Puccinia coronata f. sp. avenae]PLW57566.1 hypothetical protein PCANC_01116 [Puccinia coronata f. sp. avenae]